MSTAHPATRGTPTSYLDRTWLDHWTVLALAPIHPPDLTELRAKMLEFIASHPLHPLSSLLSPDGKRWIPVQPDDRLRHVTEVIVAGGQLDLADPFADLDANRPDARSLAPFKVVVGPDSVTYYFAHACGDAAVFSPFSVLMALGDVEGLESLRGGAGLGVALRVFGKELPAHWRDWWRHARHGSGGGAADDAPAVYPADGRGVTVACGTLLEATEFANFNSWRKASRPNVSSTALMASAVCQALAAEGVSVDGEGFFTLVDLRRHLPKSQAMRPGNLAKSIYVAADMSDPERVGAALKHMVASARAVPALLSGAVSAALGKAAETSDSVPRHVPKAVTLTFNSMLRNPGVEHIPWTDPAKAQYITMSYPAGAGGISVSACVVEERMLFSASFDPASLDRHAVARALQRLHDIPALLEQRGTEHPATLITEPSVNGAAR